MRVDRRDCLAGLSLLGFGAGLRLASAETRSMLVLAAISLKPALERLAPLWSAETGNAPLRFAYGASNALARQIVFGAPGDVFLSADLDWMAFLAARDLIWPETERVFARNRLVIIALPEHSGRLDPADSGSILAALGTERLAVARTDLVPAGRYAKEALTTLRVWEVVRDRLVETEHPRAALQLVQRGEARLGVVYASDAHSEPRVEVVADLPLKAHRPILYPACVLKGSTHPQARRFLDWLREERVQGVFRAARFGPALSSESRP